MPIQGNPNTPQMFNKLYSGVWEIGDLSICWNYEEAERIDFYNRLARLSFFDSPGRILDVGCGMGGLFKSLLNRDAQELYGIDFSAVAIEKISQRMRGVFMVGDVHQLPYDNSFFDRIVCIETLEHVDRPDQVLSEIHRTLKAGGGLLITVPDKQYDLAPEKWPGGVSLHINRFDSTGLVELTKNAGFLIESCEMINGVLQLQATKSEMFAGQGYPKIFSLETSLACDLKCPECALGGGLINREKGFMTFDQFKLIADKIRSYCSYLYLHIWGEPLLNKDIVSMVQYASSFAKTNLSTNGISLTPDLAERVICSGVSELIVSIDGVTQEVYEKYRVGGNVEKALDSLAMLQQLNEKHGSKVHIIPQFIAFKHNQHEMETFRHLCSKLGLTASFKAPYIRKNDSCFSYSDNPRLQRPHFSDIASLKAAMKSCNNPRDVFTILLDGSVVACCHDYEAATCFGNIFEQEVPTIWNSPSYVKFRGDLIAGNAPDFCIENCMTYFLDEQQNVAPKPHLDREERFREILAMKQIWSNTGGEPETRNPPEVDQMNDDIGSSLKAFHRFDFEHPDNRSFYLSLLNNPQFVGLSEADLIGKTVQQRNALILGEYFVQVGSYVNKLAGGLLFNCQWGGRESEWFDHRLHLLDPEKWFSDFWTASADNIIGVLPQHGKMLNLCSGDGFYDYYFYRKRVAEIIAVELDDEPYRHALRLHSAPNIRYLKDNVLTYQPPESYFDVVTIRGAIEHFSRQDQQVIMRKAHAALKPGGWFCGDTPARRQDNRKHLSHHVCEWADEREMRQELGHHFKHIETSTLASDLVTTLFWRCMK
ncbi:MAG: methyltransferase domain-containing protein [Geobacter sp.]